MSVNESDAEDVLAVAQEFGILENVKLEVTSTQEPSWSRAMSRDALAVARADPTGEVAFDICRLELRRALWNTGSKATQVMFVRPPPAGLDTAVPTAEHSEIWVCVPCHLIARMQRKVDELTGALGDALHQSVRVLTLEETDLAKRLPDPGDGRLRFGHDTAVFADVLPRSHPAAIAIPSSKGFCPVAVTLNDASLAPPKAISEGKFRSSSAGGYVQIGGGQGGSVPAVVVDSCGHPFRRDAIGAVVLKDTLLAREDPSNDIPVAPIAISFPGLSSAEPGLYGNLVWNGRAVPGADAAPQPLPMRHSDILVAAVDCGIYRIIQTGPQSPPCEASDMEPQPYVSHSLLVRSLGTTRSVLCLPDSRVYMGACRYHGINSPGASSTNLLDVIGFGEKVLSVKTPGRPGTFCAVETTYVARYTGGGKEPSEGDSGGDVLSDALHGAFGGEAPLHSFICSRALLSAAPPPSTASGGDAAGAGPAPTASGSETRLSAQGARGGIGAPSADAPTTASTYRPALSAVSASATAAVLRSFGGTLYTLTPAHFVLGWVEEVQADPDYHLPPGPVTFVRPRRLGTLMAAGVAAGASRK